ncbi:MAG TPA: diaminopimelate epimerase [Prevotella sp.]|nr:diaminopimelate epimerase [Prevotella sp.]
MTQLVHFTKMHGAGNDYIYVDTTRYDVPDPAAASIAWSRPHTGIGSDGLVLIGRPHNNTQADFTMRIFNADGSEAMMCGNASRCIGKYLYEKGICHQSVIRLQTLSGVKTLELHLTADDKVESVTVDMLEPRFEQPEQYTGGTVDLPASLRGHVRQAAFVSMGNPHYVIFVDRMEGIDVAQTGRLLERDQVFPERCNIEFAQLVGEDQIRTRVWERGSGITMACGTGACATGAAAAHLGLASRHTSVIMDGGTLDIRWSADDGHIYMTGPAAFAFEGDIALPEK